MSDKDRIAQELAVAHREFEPAITLIVRLLNDQESDIHEPVKLLEVNPQTSAAGILPIIFGSAPPDVPFPSIIVEVTEAEYEQICKGELALPAGWTMGATLFPAAA